MNPSKKIIKEVERSSGAGFRGGITQFGSSERPGGDKLFFESVRNGLCLRLTVAIRINQALGGGARDTGALGADELIERRTIG